MQNLGFVDSKFRLAILAAKRAKQLISGSKQRVDAKAENPLTIALEEIIQGKIDFEILMMSDAELSAEILGGGVGEESAEEGADVTGDDGVEVSSGEDIEESEVDDQSEEEGEETEEKQPEEEAE